MAYFDDGFHNFFKELAAHNHKLWFDEHRERYTHCVKRPFLRFTEAMIEAMRPMMPGIDPDPRKAVFRINRDIRFSKDKTPYKLHTAAYLSVEGKKDPTHSGFYYQFGPEHLMLGGGLYDPDPVTLLQVRRYIAQRPEALENILREPRFTEAYGGLKGTENKRINDRPLMEAAKAHPILLKKQMYVDAYLPPDDLLRDDLVDHLMHYVKAGLPLFRFFAEATTAHMDDGFH